ncbi:hypothetical protein [Helicobacter salomonis]|uniref:hypothetical protein n=1 Tax=Helicobacter salomonis TaxID=56878 RepID=UPI0013154711|nr:hypothetical protein [Helicobacter salomonis]
MDQLRIGGVTPTHTRRITWLPFCLLAFKTKMDASAASGLPLAFVALCYAIFEKNQWT